LGHIVDRSLHCTHFAITDDKSIDLDLPDHVVHVTVDAVVVTVDAVTVDGVDVVAAYVVVVCCSITVSANSAAAVGFTTVSLLVDVIPGHVNTNVGPRILLSQRRRKCKKAIPNK